MFILIFACSLMNEGKLIIGKEEPGKENDLNWMKVLTPFKERVKAPKMYQTVLKTHHCSASSQLAHKNVVNSRDG